jgi:hypothetical protein
MSNDHDHDHDSSDSRAAGRPANPVIPIFAWLAVAIPLLFGIAQTITKAAALFR